MSISKLRRSKKRSLQRSAFGSGTSTLSVNSGHSWVFIVYCILEFLPSLLFHYVLHKILTRWQRCRKQLHQNLCLCPYLKIFTQVFDKEKGMLIKYSLDQWFRVPNHCSGDHKFSAGSLEVLPVKFEIHNILCRIEV